MRTKTNARIQQKQRRAQRLKDGVKRQPGLVSKTPFVTRTVRFVNHPRRHAGYRRWRRSEAILKQEAAVERLVANQARLAGMRAEGVPLPGQQPTPATARK